MFVSFIIFRCRYVDLLSCSYRTIFLYQQLIWWRARQGSKHCWRNQLDIFVIIFCVCNRCCLHHPKSIYPEWYFIPWHIFFSEGMLKFCHDQPHLLLTQCEYSEEKFFIMYTLDNIYWNFFLHYLEYGEWHHELNSNEIILLKIILGMLSDCCDFACQLTSNDVAQSCYQSCIILCFCVWFHHGGTVQA